MNFNDPTLCTSLLFINNLGSKSRRSTVLFGLWNREYFVLSAFNESLFALMILTWKNLGFTEFSTKIHWSTRLAASDVFHMFTQSTINVYRCLKNVIHQIDSKNEWLLLSVIFSAKLELVFVLTFKNVFS